MVGLRGRCDGMRAGLPNAGSEVEPGLVVRDTIPVHDELMWRRVSGCAWGAGNGRLTPPLRTASSCACLSASYSAMKKMSLT